jgi:hypothetical protein
MVFRLVGVEVANYIFSASIGQIAMNEIRNVSCSIQEHPSSL